MKEDLQKFEGLTNLFGDVDLAYDCVGPESNGEYVVDIGFLSVEKEPTEQSEGQKTS